MKHPVGCTRNGIAVEVDLIHSKAAQHISRQPHLVSLVEEALRQTTFHGPEGAIECDMGRTVGYSLVVPTTDTDNIFYAQRLYDDTYTRFVKNGKPSSTQYLTLVLRLSADGDDTAYELQDAWIGRLSPPRPGSSNETAESKPYWANHAYVPDSRPLQSRTVTKVCPY